MILLAVETSTPQGSLAISEIEQDQCRVLAEEVWDKKSTHSDVVTLKLDEALTKSNKKISDLTHFAVDLGPGSFTGLRVGINLIKSLSYSTSKPVLTFSSLEVMAFERLSDGETALVAIPAIQNLYYFAVCQKKSGVISTILPASSGTLEDIKNHSQSGTKALVEGQGGTSLFRPLAKELAHMAARGGSHYTFQTWRQLKPLYVRQSEAEEKLKKVSTENG